MSAVVSKKKRDRQSATQASTRHSGERGNTPTSSFRAPRSGDPESSASASARHSGEGRNPVTESTIQNANAENYSGWRWATLGDTGRYINGVAFKPSDWVGEGLPIIRIQNLTDPRKPLNRTMREVDPIYRVNSGDLLVSWSATLDAFLWDREPGLLNQHIFKVVPDENVVGKRFLFYLLKMAIAEMIKSEHLHGSTMKHINRGPFLAHRVLIPPLHVQHQIVADVEKQFTRLDAGVAALRRVQANLKRYRAAVLKAACEGRLVPTEAELAKAEGRTYETGEQLLARILVNRRKNFRGRGKYKEPAIPDTTNLPRLPEGWAWATFEQIAERVTVGYVGPMKHEYKADGVPFLRGQNVRENRFDPEGLLYVSRQFHEQLAKSALHPGDLAVVRSGAVGVTCVIPESLPEANCSDLVLVQRPLGFVPQYGAYYMNSVAKRHVIAGKVGVALTHFNTKSVAAIPVPLPPMAEQERIVAEVECRLSLIEELEAALTANLQRATRLRQSILQRAFVGAALDA
ncbi:MAG TPA: restriction endonuclease subunit S [Rhodanobacteraceae bacterium]|nr:restriction endonuclease subunit S [Rhodanobacteraceae bacterium]